MRSSSDHFDGGDDRSAAQPLTDAASDRSVDDAAGIEPSVDDRESPVDDGSPDGGDVGRASIRRNLLHLLFSQVTTGVLGMVLVVVQPRFLGPEAVGQLRLLMSIWLIAIVVVGLGTSMWLTLEVARDRRRGLSMVGPVLVIRAIAFAVVSAGLLLGMAVLGTSADFVVLVVIQGISFFFLTMSDVFVATFHGFEQMGVPARVNVIIRLASTTATIGVLIAGGDVTSVVAVGAAANAASLLMMSRAFRRVARTSFGGWRRHAAAIVLGSAGFLASRLIIVTYNQVDTIVIAALLEPRALGWYSTADAAFGSLLFITTVLMKSLFPVIGRLYQENRAEMRSLVSRAASSLLLLAVPAGLGLTVIGGQLAPLVFGDEFAESGQVLSVYGVVIALTFWNVLFGAVALATERQRLWNTVMIIAIVLTIPLDLLLVPWADANFANGAIGGAMAYVVTEAFMVFIAFWKVVPYLRNRDFLWRSTRIVLAGLVMLAATWPLRDEVLIVPIVVGAFTYSAAILVFRALTDEQRRAIGAGLARIGIRTRWSRTARDPDRDDGRAPERPASDQVQ